MIIEDAKKYWEIVSRYHRHRHNKNILPIAIFELRGTGGRSQAVNRRVQSFVAKHQRPPPTNSPNGGGKQLA